MSRIFALVDCNSFYCSCERIFKPHLENHPVIVLSNNDGCAIALSTQAKELGVKMGDPYFKIKELIHTHNIAVFSSNYAFYGDISKRVMATLGTLSTNLEIYSIDEAFLDFSDIQSQDRERHAAHIQHTVRRNTGVPVSIGIGSTKTLAKIANRIAKKNPELGGIFSLTDPEKVARVLPFVACGDIWGIGPACKNKLEALGITTADHLARADPKQIRQMMGVVGERIVHELRGTSCLPLELATPAKKSIVCSRSFGAPLTKKEDVRAALHHHLMRGCRKLRKQMVQARHLSIFIQGKRFSKTLPYYANAAATTLLLPSNYTPDLSKAADLLFERIWKENTPYTKAGIMLGDFVPHVATRASLFDTRDFEKQRKVMEAVDTLNARYGSSSITFANAAHVGQLHPAWQMRQNLRSPGYTTSWLDLATVR